MAEPGEQAAVSKSHGSDSPPGVVALGTPGLGPILAAVMSMLASSPNHEVLLVEEQLFSVEERAALAGFLAGYAGLTRDAYTLDLRHTRRGGSGTACLCSPPAGADIECFAAAVRGSTGLAPGGVQMSSPGGANRAESIAQLSRRVESGSGRVSGWPPRMESFKTPEAHCG